MSRIYFNTIEEKQFAERMMNEQLPHETEAHKALLLSIAKKVYTKLSKSRKLPYDVLSEIGEKIKNRDYYYMSMTFCKSNLKMLAQYC